MIKYEGKNDFKPQQTVIVDALPAGAYVGKILGAKVETISTRDGGSFDRLAIQMDVSEGEYAGHYKKQYEAQKGGQYDAKFKGVLRLNVPVAGSQYEAGNKRAFENLAWCLEQSNKGYHWDWDETKLKGMNVGFSVRERDWIMERDGIVSSGTTTEIGRIENVQDVRDGKVKPMKKRALSDVDKKKLEDYGQSTADYTETVAQDEELPF